MISTATVITVMIPKEFDELTRDQGIQKLTQALRQIQRQAPFVWDLVGDQKPNAIEVFQYAAAHYLKKSDALVVWNLSENRAFLRAVVTYLRRRLLFSIAMVLQPLPFSIPFSQGTRERAIAEASLTRKRRYLLRDAIFHLESLGRRTLQVV